MSITESSIEDIADPMIPVNAKYTMGISQVPDSNQMELLAIIPPTSTPTSTTLSTEDQEHKDTQPPAIGTQSENSAEISTESHLKSKPKLEAACILCVSSKVKCDLGRPCSRCTRKGLGDLCIDRRIPSKVIATPLKEACIICIASKFKCDMESPCSRCCSKGYAKLCLGASQGRQITRQGCSSKTGMPSEEIPGTLGCAVLGRKRVRSFADIEEQENIKKTVAEIASLPRAARISPASCFFDQIIAPKTIESMLNRHKTLSPFAIQKLVAHTPCRWFGYLRALSKVADNATVMRIKSEMYETAASLSKWYEMSFVRMIVLSNICRIRPKVMVPDRISTEVLLNSEQIDILADIYGSKETVLKEVAIMQFRPTPLALSGKENFIRMNFDVSQHWFEYIGFSTKDMVDFWIELGNHQRSWAPEDYEHKDPAWFLKFFDPSSWGRYFELFHTLWFSDFVDSRSSSWMVFENMTVLTKSGKQVVGKLAMVASFNIALCGIPRRVLFTFKPNPL